MNFVHRISSLCLLSVLWSFIAMPLVVNEIRSGQKHLTKGINSKYKELRVINHVHCTSSKYPLSVCEFHFNNFGTLWDMLRTKVCRTDGRNDRQNDGRTDRRTGCKPIAPNWVPVGHYKLNPDPTLLFQTVTRPKRMFFGLSQWAFITIDQHLYQLIW